MCVYIYTLSTLNTVGSPIPGTSIGPWPVRNWAVQMAEEPVKLQLHAWDLGCVRNHTPPPHPHPWSVKDSVSSETGARKIGTADLYCSIHST